MNKNIIFESLAGRATPLQKQLIASWLSQAENTELYYEWLDEWENSNLQFSANPEPALQKIRVHDSAARRVPYRLPAKNLLYWFRTSRLGAAAAVFVIIIISAYFLKDIIIYKSVSTGYGEVSSVILPDGSKVSLNANSSIKFPRFGFGKNSRVVYLKGEADFAVIHTGSHQKFIVKTESRLNVTVLGTQFTVYARMDKSKVVLQTGKVELSYVSGRENKKMMMKPGDMFISDTNREVQVKHIANPEKLTAWKNRDFLFEATSLAEIAVMLKDNYGYNIVFEKPEIATKKISGSFHAPEMKNLLEAISDLLDMNYRITEKTISFF